MNKYAYEEWKEYLFLEGIHYKKSKVDGPETRSGITQLPTAPSLTSYGLKFPTNFRCAMDCKSTPYMLPIISSKPSIAPPVRWGLATCGEVLEPP